MEKSEIKNLNGFSYLTPLIAGGLAGLSVDVSLYPVDTIKTRLQSEQGFYKAGGFRGIYRGLGAVIAGSVPTSALFFISYEVVKSGVTPLVAPQYAPAVHMLAASFGEVVACLVRVPTEIVKQRKQTYSGSSRRNGLHMLLEAYRTEGLRRGVYRGFFSTVMRDMPFSFIEMPIWEFLKSQVRQRNGGHINSVELREVRQLQQSVDASVHLKRQCGTLIVKLWLCKVKLQKLQKIVRGVRRSRQKQLSERAGREKIQSAFEKRIRIEFIINLRHGDAHAIILDAEIVFTTKIKRTLKLFIEQGIRGRLSQCSYRYARANNKYMCDYNPQKESRGAICGSIAGGVAGAITTPLDLAKTRIMLAEDYTLTRRLEIRPVLRQIYVESGLTGLFAGLAPRVVAFTIGGFVFFGAYDYAKELCGSVLS